MIEVDGEREGGRRECELIQNSTQDGAVAIIESLWWCPPGGRGQG